MFAVNNIKRDKKKKGRTVEDRKNGEPANGAAIDEDETLEVS